MAYCAVTFFTMSFWISVELSGKNNDQVSYYQTIHAILINPNLHYSQKANKLLYLTELMISRSKASKNSICLLFSGAFTLGHLLRCESLEIDHYVCGFRRLASDPN